LYPASVPENFSSSFHLCVCVTLVEREERLSVVPFLNWPVKLVTIGKDFFSLSYSFLTSIFFFFSLLFHHFRRLRLPIWILEIQRSGGGAHNRHFIVPVQ
jgi:hypothetical protein